MYYRTCTLHAIRNDLTASGFTVTTIPLTALGRRADGSPLCRLVVASTAAIPGNEGGDGNAVDFDHNDNIGRRAHHGRAHNIWSAVRRAARQ
jgi:hypothetical protein